MTEFRVTSETEDPADAALGYIHKPAPAFAMLHTITIPGLPGAFFENRWSYAERGVTIPEPWPSEGWQASIAIAVADANVEARVKFIRMEPEGALVQEQEITGFQNCGTVQQIDFGPFSYSWAPGNPRDRPECVYEFASIDRSAASVQVFLLLFAPIATIARPHELGLVRASSVEAIGALPVRDLEPVGNTVASTVESVGAAVASIRSTRGG